MGRTSGFGVGLALVVLLAAPARAQEWKLDASLQALTNAQRNALVTGVQKAPQKALEALIDRETAHIEKLAESDLEPFAEEAWKRILAGREEGHLWRAIGAELRAAGVVSRDLLRKVWAEERERLRTAPEDLVYGTVDRALKAALIDRIRAIRDARLEAWRLHRDGGDPRGAKFPLDQPVTHFTWRETRDDGVSIDTSLPLPKVTFFSKKASLEEVLYQETFRTEVGDLKVTAAKVEGLYDARAGRVTYKDAFNNEVEGLGATFTARAKLTGARGDFRSKNVGAAGRHLGVTAHLNAMAEAASNVEATSTTLVTENGLGTHNEVRAGAGASASARLPIVVDLKVLKVHVIPYASVHAGASASAHATFEVEWSGTIRLDLGAHASTGVGFGAGVVVQLELGPVLKAALTKLMTKIGSLVRPIADALMGRTWKGPSVDSNRLTLELDDLEELWRERGEARPAAELSSPDAVAARYAPVFYQEIDRGIFDLIRRVDFDGDWNTENNWNNTTPEADSSAWVYYDVKETDTHYYVTYVLYHSGRKSNAAIKLLRNMRRHENDMGGVTVVARKGAARGREVEVVMAHDGDATYVYSGLERQDGERTRWRTAHGFWSGPVKFVNEVDHPLFDEERTHPQMWVAGKDHTVYGFTGRDDADPFSGEKGVVYAYTGQAERPDSPYDHQVGYALRPLDELLQHLNSEETFSRDELVRPRGARQVFPAKLRGDEGPDDSVRAPWAWRYWQQEEDRDDDSRDSFRGRDEYIEAGDVFVDPARVLATLYRVPDGFGRTYLRNTYASSALLTPAAAEERRAPAAGLIDGLERSTGR